MDETKLHVVVLTETQLRRKLSRLLTCKTKHWKVFNETVLECAKKSVYVERF